MGLLLAPAAAAEYPTRPVSLIVAFTPGGPSDVLARIVGRKIGELLGQPIVIENRLAPAATSRPNWSRARHPTATHC
jgi:tripartite-type tricarboxylate transporter receptor subunit TctC